MSLSRVSRVLVVAGSLSLLAAPSALAPAFDLESHRGGRGLRPENTLASFGHSLQLVGRLGGVGLVVTWWLPLMGLERMQEVRAGTRAGAIAGYGAMALVGGLCTLALLGLGLWAITNT